MMDEENTQLEENSVEPTQSGNDLTSQEGQQGEEGSAAQPSSNEGEGKQRQSTPAWVQRRIDELTAARRAAERERDTLKEQLRGNSTEAKPVTQNPTPVSEEELEQRVEARLRLKRFNERCNDVYKEAVKADPNFAEAYQGMAKAVGTPSMDFLEQVVEQPDAHAILSYMASDYDEAARILSLPPLAQGRELERLTAKLAKGKSQRSVSGAPAPIRPIDSGSSSSKTNKDLSEMSIEEFMRERNKSRSTRS